MRTKIQFPNLSCQRYLSTTNCNDFIQKIQIILIKKFSANFNALVPTLEFS